MPVDEPDDEESDRLDLSPEDLLAKAWRIYERYGREHGFADGLRGAGLHGRKGVVRGASPTNIDDATRWVNFVRTELRAGKTLGVAMDAAYAAEAKVSGEEDAPLLVVRHHGAAVQTSEARTARTGDERPSVNCYAGGSSVEPAIRAVALGRGKLQPSSGSNPERSTLKKEEEVQATYGTREASGAETPDRAAADTAALFGQRSSADERPATPAGEAAGSTPAVAAAPVRATEVPMSNPIPTANTGHRQKIIDHIKEHGPTTAAQLKESGKFPLGRAIMNALYHGERAGVFAKAGASPDGHPRYALGSAATHPSRTVATASAGAAARNAALSPEERRAIAKNAGHRRWKTRPVDHPTTVMAGSIVEILEGRKRVMTEQFNAEMSKLDKMIALALE